MWIGPQWLGIKLGTGGKYGNITVIGKQVNTTGQVPNGMDVAHIKLAICTLAMVLTMAIIIIRQH